MKKKIQVVVISMECQIINWTLNQKHYFQFSPVFPLTSLFSIKSGVYAITLDHVTHTHTLAVIRRQHFAQSTTASAHLLSARNQPLIQQASSSSASSPVLSPPGKTLGRNNNGTSKYQTVPTGIQWQSYKRKQNHPLVVGPVFLHKPGGEIQSNKQWSDE